MRGGVALGSVAASASVYRWFNPTAMVAENAGPAVDFKRVTGSEEELLARGWLVDEVRTSERNILNYNNFYEFTTQKEALASAAANFKTGGWQIVIDGLVSKPMTISHQSSNPRKLFPFQDPLGEYYREVS